jgi:hypothetical protein
VKGWGLDEAAAVAILKRWSERKCAEDPWTDRQIEHTVANAARFGSYRDLVGEDRLDRR